MEALSERVADRDPLPLHVVLGADADPVVDGVAVPDAVYVAVTVRLGGGRETVPVAEREAVCVGAKVGDTVGGEIVAVAVSVLLGAVGVGVWLCVAGLGEGDGERTRVRDKVTVREMLGLRGVPVHVAVTDTEDEPDGDRDWEWEAVRTSDAVDAVPVTLRDWLWVLL